MQDFQDSISPDLSPIVVDGNSVGIDADPTVTLQQVAVIESLTTNAGIVLKPNGTGAIMAQVPDGTVAGGNARGQNAVDLQMSRSNADQVAGYNFDVITGGRNNKISANLDGYRFIGGGYQNTISVAGYSTINGGRQNSISGGGSAYCTISGGQSNTASTNSHATVVGGKSNTASGAYSVAGGWVNTASGFSSVALGRNCTATNDFSVALGGYAKANGLYSACIGGSFGTGSYATASYSIALGAYTKSYLYGQLAHSGNDFDKSYSTGANRGESQISFLNPSRIDTLSSAATTVLSLDGTGTTNLIIPDGTNRAWNVTVKWVAVVTSITGTATGVSVGDTIMQVDTFGFKRIGGTSSMVGSANTLSTNNDTSMATAAMGYTAGTSQELKLTFTAPTFTGGGSVTCRVVAKVELTEVAY